MSCSAQTTVAEARAVANFLDSIGEHKRANDVRKVCRSNDSYQSTLSQLHKDNMELRREQGERRMPMPDGPKEGVLHIAFDLELSGELMKRLEHECGERKLKPAALMANILETVIKDGLFEAVIGE